MTAAAIQQLRAPNMIHVVTLLVIASLLVALVRRRMRRLLVAMNLSPVSVLLAVSVVVITLGILYAGAEMIAERQREYEATLNPPPAAINTVLPDAESLRRGEALYGEHCIVWQGQSADFRALRNRLDTVRDDFLYIAITTGWRDLQACAGDLSETERWDVVNYFRTFEARD